MIGDDHAKVDRYFNGLLGHKDRRSTARYSHLSTEILTAAVGMIGQKIPNTPQRKTA